MTDSKWQSYNNYIKVLQVNLEMQKFFFIHIVHEFNFAWLQISPIIAWIYTGFIGVC